MDRPYDMSNRNDVIRYANDGGYTDIAETLKSRGIRWIPDDVVYCEVLRICVEYAMEESLASLDILFYRESPDHGNPHLGVHWPASTLIDGLKVFFIDGDAGRWSTIIKRSDTDSRGVNYVFDHTLGRDQFQYEISMYCEVQLLGGGTQVFDSQRICLEPRASNDPKTVYELVRKKTGMKVKPWLD